jgi:hypothetical protein
MLRKRRADQTDLKRCILRSRRHTTWCEFWAGLFLRSSYSRQLDVVEGGAVGAQLIGYHHLWREALFSQQLANQVQSCAPVSPALNQHMADLPPRGRPPATDTSTCRRSGQHLVEMPAIARPRTAPPYPSCDNRSEFHHPAANRLVRNVEPSLGKEFLDVAAQIQPDGVLDDDRRKAMTATGDWR